MIKKLLILGVLTISTAALSYPAYCFDCSDAEHDCTQEALQELNDCCQIWGCETSGTVNYCANKAAQRRCACGLVKACPLPNCGSN